MTGAVALRTVVLKIEKGVYKETHSTKSTVINPVGVYKETHFKAGDTLLIMHYQRFF